MSVIESSTHPVAAEQRRPLGTAAWQTAIRRFFQVVSIVECFTWVGMLTGMAFKYLINGNGIGVTIFGWAHGVTWLCYLAAAVVTAVTFRWKIWVLVVGAAASTLPFLTLPFERWMAKSGRLVVNADA